MNTKIPKKKPARLKKNTESAEKKARNSALATPGKVMGTSTIAEFVENEAILEKLREIGVDYAQGYGIGRPVPIKKIAAIDARHDTIR